MVQSGVQSGSEWYRKVYSRVVQSGMECYRMVQSCSEWYRVVQSGTEVVVSPAGPDPPAPLVPLALLVPNLA